MGNTDLKVKEATYIETSKEKEYVKKVLEEFEDNLCASINPFQEISKYNETRENLKRLQGELKKIGKEYKRELNEISPDYHKTVLELLEYSLTVFYTLRNSEASRELDKVSEFARFLNVPHVDYIDAVLGNTPKDYLQGELEDQLKEKKISEEELKFLIKKYDLVTPTNYDKTKEIKGEQCRRPTLSRLLKKILIKP